jgi:thioredoxin 1
MILDLKNKTEFKEHVESSAIALVDFWAQWCGPCRNMHKVLEEIDVEYAHTLKMYKVNIDECPDVATDYQIMSIPTFILFVGGQMIDRKVGGMDKTTLVEWIKSHTKL